MALLGVNIDHFATLRQLRNTPYPDLIEVARMVINAGADQITVHLREDRRHIQDSDVRRLRSEIRTVLNLEMAVAESIVRFAVKTKPDWACLVPEKRQEVTTEGGLDLKKGRRRVGEVIQRLKKAGIRVSLFIEPTSAVVKLSAELGADAVEFHTGRYCLAFEKNQKAQCSRQVQRLKTAIEFARQSGLGVHAGHGLSYENIRPLLDALRNTTGIEEFNIGHSIVCRSAMVGVDQAVRELRSLIVLP